jgi:hypothetical protein
MRRSEKSSPKTRATARVFWSGRSQAVRLPRQFRMSSPVVLIHREGTRIVLEAPEVELDEKGWPRGFWENLGTLDASFDLGDRTARAERSDPLRPRP